MTANSSGRTLPRASPTANTSTVNNSLPGAAFERVIAALEQHGRKVVRRGATATAQCPAHDDTNPSLSVRDGDGHVLLYCHAGCGFDAVRAALRLSKSDMYDNPHGQTYRYDDGRTVNRTPDKRFYQSGNKDGPPTLYRAAEVAQAAGAGRTVYLVEGEKDADNLRKLAGVTATTAPMGAANFDKVEVPPLQDADVVAIVDRDDKGDTWAAQVGAKLEGVAASLRFVRAGAGKDPSDHLAAGLELDVLENYQFPDVGQGDPDCPEGADRVPLPSWAPVDLGPFLDGTFEVATPSLLPRSDGVCLVYRGLSHSFHGESESGKSLVLQIEAVRLLMAGERVLFVDFESDAASIVGRLIEFGATRDAIQSRFVYLRPEVRPDTAPELHAWLSVLQEPFALAIVDGVTDSLGVFGYKTKENDDGAAWHRELPRRIADRTGAAVVVVDHVTKDTESRGRYALGGQAKLSALTGAAYTVEVDKPLGRGLRGVIVLRVAKDRPGSVRGQAGPMRAKDRTQEVARITIDSTGRAPVVTVEPWRGHDNSPDAPAQQWRPTALMEALSRALEQANEPLSSNQLAALVRGKADYKRQALAELEKDKFVTITPGSNNSKLHASIKPYRQADDPDSDKYQRRDTPKLSEPESNPSSECVPVSHPYTGEWDTHTQPTLTVSGTHPGHTRDTLGRGANPTLPNLDSTQLLSDPRCTICGAALYEPESEDRGICTSCYVVAEPVRRPSKAIGSSA